MTRLSLALAVSLFLLPACSSGQPATPQRDADSAVKRQTSCPPCLYVANYLGNSVTVYSVGTAGDAKPIQYITGSKTQLDYPSDVALDSTGNMYVVGYDEALDYNAVTVYAAGATGNVAPTAVISGLKTRLNSPSGIAVDRASADIYVLNATSITVYSAGSNGNVAPTRTIEGGKTELADPQKIALDDSGNIYVVNSKSNSVTVYPARSSGNVAPIRRIRGSSTNLDGPTAVALDSGLNIWVANYGPPNSASEITAFAAGAHGNISPMNWIAGKMARLHRLMGVALDSSNDVYASEFNFNSITFYAAGATGNVKPVGIIAGRATGLDSPRGISIQ